MVHAFDRDAALRADDDALEAMLEDPRSLLVPVWRDQTFVAAERLGMPTLETAGALLDEAGVLL